MPVPHKIITASNVIGQPPPPPPQHTHTQKHTHGWNVQSVKSSVFRWHLVESHLRMMVITHGIIIRKATSLGSHAPMHYRFTLELFSVVSAAVSLMNGFTWHWIKVVSWQQSISSHHEIHSIWSTFILTLCSALLEFVFLVSETTV